MAADTRPKALLFDVFGTVVDWRTSVIEECRAFGERTGHDQLDWEAFADRWRALYQPSMDEVRSGLRPWVPLDVLHRESLAALAVEHGLTQATEADLDDLNFAWHRLRPWPDAPPGLARLRTVGWLVTCSNGNVALLADLARFGRLPFDATLGPSVARVYKPQPEAYLATAELLGLEPASCLMVAAHNLDLVAARALGFSTAFVPRPTEHGPGQQNDLVPIDDWDVVASDFLDLADQLGAPTRRG